MKIVVLCFMFLANTVFAESLPSFFEAKKEILLLLEEYPQTLYCGCSFDMQGNLIKNACSINATKYKERSQKIEMEHMFAMSHAKHHFACWREGGRSNCQKKDPSFNKFEAELYNLWPAIGSINAGRSNFRFTEFRNEEKQNLGWFDNCPIYIDKRTRRVEPRNEVKGVIARAHLFVSEHYSINLSNKQRQLFVTWNNKFPPNDVELQWAAKIYKIQGYHNPYIVNYKVIEIQ